MAETRKRERAGEREHAAKYLHMRWRYGRDHNAWPADAASEEEGR
jgi:hypothetical protein